MGFSGLWGDMPPPPLPGSGVFNLLAMGVVSFALVLAGVFVVRRVRRGRTPVD